jgi:hypothetical protein
MQLSPDFRKSMRGAKDTAQGIDESTNLHQKCCRLQITHSLHSLTHQTTTTTMTMTMTTNSATYFKLNRNHIQTQNKTKQNKTKQNKTKPNEIQEVLQT